MVDTVIIAVSSVFAVVVGVVLTWFITHRPDEHKWKLMRSRDIPLWVVHRFYVKHFPNKVAQFQTEYVLRGVRYEYEVVVKEFSIDEPNARVHHLVVRRRRRTGK